MCLDRRLMPRKARIFLAIGNLCLFTGVAMVNFNLASHAHRPGWFDFVRGLLFGLAIAFNLAALRMSRRCPPTQPLNQ